MFVVSSLHRRHRALCDERGAAAVIVAIVMVVLLGMTAFVVDIARAYEERRELQRTADVSALSGAQMLLAGADPAEDTAEEYIGRNPTTYHQGSYASDPTRDIIEVGRGVCDVPGYESIDGVDVTVRARTFDYTFGRVFGLDGRYLNDDGSGNPLWASACAMLGGSAAGGENVVPWIVTDCPAERWEGGDYTAALSAVNAQRATYGAQPCPYEFSTTGWSGPREQLFLDRGRRNEGNFQGGRLMADPCPDASGRPATPDGLFPTSGSPGGDAYRDFLSGAADSRVPCNIAPGARLFPQTGALVGPTNQGLDGREDPLGNGLDTCMNESAFNDTVRGPVNGVYQIINRDNPCLVVILFVVHINQASSAGQDVPGGNRIPEFQHPQAVDTDGDGSWRFARPLNGVSNIYLVRRLAFFYITDKGPLPAEPVEGIFLRALDSHNSEFDGTPCDPEDGICTVRLAR